MPNNNRIYWAVKAVGIAPFGSTSYIAAKGVQSAGVSLDFDLMQAFELGQGAIYENIEKLPEISITLEKLMDGTAPLYHLMTRGWTSDNLQGRANQRCQIAVAAFSDLNQSASGTQVCEITHSGAYVSSVQLQFPVDGMFTESVTAVGNNRVFRTAGFQFTGGFLNTDTSVLASGGVNRREDFVWDCAATALDTNGQVASNVCTVFPTNIAGINTSGINTGDANGYRSCAVQNVSVNVNLGRDAIYELGHKGPYFRYVNFPVEVGCEIEIISKSGDTQIATENGILTGINAGNNLSNQSIRIYTREGTFVNLGTQNKLQSVNVNGGDVGGSNETITYKYVTYSDFIYTHPQGPA